MKNLLCSAIVVSFFMISLYPMESSVERENNDTFFIVTRRTSTNHCLSYKEDPNATSPLFKYRKADYAVTILSWKNKLLAAGTSEGDITIFPSEHSPRLEHLEGHKGAINGIDWYSESLLASASQDKSVGIWDRTNKKVEPINNSVPLFHSLEHPDVVTSVLWGINKDIFSTCSDKKLRRWDSASGLLLAVYPNVDYIVSNYSYSFINVCSNKNFFTINLINKKANPHYDGSKKQTCITNFIKKIPIEDSLGSYSKDLIEKLSQYPYENSVSLSPCNKFIANVSSDAKAVEIWNILTGKMCATLNLKPSGSFTTIAWNEDSKTIAVGNSKGYVDWVQLTVVFPLKKNF